MIFHSSGLQSASKAIARSRVLRFYDSNPQRARESKTIIWSMAKFGKVKWNQDISSKYTLVYRRGEVYLYT